MAHLFEPLTLRSIVLSLVPTAQIPAGPGFQTAFARVRHEAGVATSAVGLITSPAQADHIVRTGQADMVLWGREILRNPYWPLGAAQAPGQAVPWPRQYPRAAPAGSGRALEPVMHLIPAE